MTARGASSLSAVDRVFDGCREDVFIEGLADQPGDRLAAEALLDLAIVVAGDDHDRNGIADLSNCGERSGTVYRLGDIIKVRLTEAAPLTGGLRFDLADDVSHLRPQKRHRGRPVRPAKRSRR